MQCFLWKLQKSIFQLLLSNFVTSKNGNSTLPTSALHIKPHCINSFRSLLPFRIAWFCLQIPTGSATQTTVSNFKEWGEVRELRLVIKADHFSHPHMQPGVWSHSTGEGQEVLDGPIKPLPRLLWPKKEIWVRTASWSSQNDCPFLLIAWWKTVPVVSHQGTKASLPPHSIHTSACAKKCKLHLLELHPRGGGGCNLDGG